MNTQVFIFNYSHFEEAMDLFKKFSKMNYDTFLLNCECANDPDFEETEKIKKLKNVYYSGQWNETLKIASADVLFLINSDVKIPKINYLMKRLEKFYDQFAEKAGIYAPNHEWTPWTYNPYLLPTLEFGYKVVPSPDSTLWAITRDMASKVGQIDIGTNLYGWGIEIVAAYLCNKENKHVVRDYNVKCFHPRGTAYNRHHADVQFRQWITQQKLGQEFWEYYNSRDKYEFGWNGSYQPNSQQKML